MKAIKLRHIARRLKGNVTTKQARTFPFRGVRVNPQGLIPATRIERPKRGKAAYKRNPKHRNQLK